MDPLENDNVHEEKNKQFSLCGKLGTRKEAVFINLSLTYVRK